MPAGLVIGALAVLALGVAGVLIFKPNTPTQTPATTPVAVAPPVVTTSTHAASPLTVAHKPAAHQVTKPKVVAVAPTPQATATVAPTATPKPATPKPATPPPTPKPAAQKAIAWHQQAAPKHVARYGQLYQPATGSVVALGGIEAYYGPRGRAVRVLWGAAEQASATVQLVDEHGTTVSSGSVRGSRTSLLLYLPRGFRGPLTVQVSSIGKLGERVAQTTSLSAFGQ
jgi:cytoskeletal protein RodZ